MQQYGWHDYPIRFDLELAGSAMKLLIIVALFCRICVAQAGGSGVPILGSTQAVTSTSYSAFKTITIDHTKVPSAQTNFPVLFAGTYSYLADTGHGGSVTNANGYDFIFSSTNNLDGSGKIAFDRV